MVTQNISPAFLLAATQATPRPADGLRSVSSAQRPAAQPTQYNNVLLSTFIHGGIYNPCTRWRRCSKDLGRRGLAAPEKVYYMVGVEVAWVNVARDPIEVFK